MHMCIHTGGRHGAGTPWLVLDIWWALALGRPRVYSTVSHLGSSSRTPVGLVLSASAHRLPLWTQSSCNHFYILGAHSSCWMQRGLGHLFQGQSHPHTPSLWPVALNPEDRSSPRCRHSEEKAARPTVASSICQAHSPATPALTSQVLLVSGHRNSTGLKLQVAYSGSG